MFELFFFWLIGSVVVSIVASSKGRFGFGYFLLSVLISPLIAGFMVLAMPNLNAQTVVASAEEKATPETHVRCPDCRELVIKDARKCKHCGTALTPDAS